MPAMLFCPLRLSARGSQGTCFIYPIMGPLIGDFRQQARLLAKTFGLCGLSQTLQLKSVGRVHGPVLFWASVSSPAP